MSRAVVVALAVLLCAACFGSADESFKCNVNGGRCRPLRNHVHVAKMAQDATEGETAYAEAEEAYDEMQAGIADATKQVNDTATAVTGAQVTMNAILEFSAITSNYARRYSDAVGESGVSNTAVSTARNQLSNAVSRSKDATFASNSGVSKAQEAETKLDEAKNEAVDAQKKVKADAAKKAVASAVTFFERALRQADLALTAVEKVNESAMYAESASYRATVYGSAQRARNSNDGLRANVAEAEANVNKASDGIASAEKRIAKLPVEQQATEREKLTNAKNAIRTAQEGLARVNNVLAQVQTHLETLKSSKDATSAAGYENTGVLKTEADRAKQASDQVEAQMQEVAATMSEAASAAQTAANIASSFETKGDNAAGFNAIRALALLCVTVFAVFVI